MLDPERKNVLEILRRLTGEDGTFKVIEAEEVLEKLPADSGMSKQQLSVVIRDLRDRDYIQVKYFTPDEYCLLTLKHTEELAQMVEEVTAVATLDKQTEQTGRRSAGAIGKGAVFLFAFLGALLGGGIVAAIAILLQKFVL